MESGKERRRGKKKRKGEKERLSGIKEEGPICLNLHPLQKLFNSRTGDRWIE
jgi:hypothetical protein